MTGIRTSKLQLTGMVTAVAAAVALAACGSSSGNSNAGAAAVGAASGATPTRLAVSTTSGPSGTYLTASGRALYLWVADAAGQSACSGDCAKAWPPLLAKATPSVAGGVTASELGTLTRSDGNKQVTYMGHPLYYFIGDKGPGTTNGQGSDNFGAKWWLVSKAGSAITSGASRSSGSPGYSSSGGGWG